ncbi:unnamed protein product [Pieris macdunnoughi]|uniref:Uncharacterized protein n=1 Tax=Pieris macdunnoughi TaxID=345717 RepID=A0A821QFH2_9NEOP|nr:unnamed protein product [Pieris macdunnoughi]
MSSVQEEKLPEGTQKTHVRELRNTELVSRLLAATPPYLYSALPLQPHAFFFSEMLRSFVNASPRRDWAKQEEEKKEETRPEVPLELTVDKQPSVCDPLPRRLSPKPELPKSNESPGPPGRQSTFVDVGTEELPKPSPCIPRNMEQSVPQPNLILPPPPPMWYPPIYNPQFGVDPLNFFIDLRVSGHIYDRKRAVEDPNTSETRPEEPLEKRLGKDFGQRPRHLSAFSVPVRGANAEEYFERNGGFNKTGASYVMKNLKRVYDGLHNHEHREAKVSKNDEKTSDVDDEQTLTD